ncbi:hypothetical protein DCCM_3241 [Desulfocucumis palustris]|uniref:Uncharacterized protein n=1 Tax=Desulfocucumis palustris TaxID=1898651 RepID=A0A2L2XCR3_9FIRM|nr:hypothetical protein [Desulfocucumis palustris]GBF34129.1 hypothetical protein DCCM_3241 [Desulfocucumis palustris]
MDGAAQALPPSLLFPALLILISILSAAVGIIGYFLKDIKVMQKEKDDKQDKAIQDVKDELADFKAQMPHVYVMRDDYVREISSLNLKMDRVIREVSGLAKIFRKTGGGDDE